MKTDELARFFQCGIFASGFFPVDRKRDKENKMPLVLISIFCGVFLFVVVDSVSRVCKLPVLASLAVALAVTVAFESVVLNVLSLFSMVQATPLLVVHLIMIGGWAGCCIMYRKTRGHWNFSRYLSTLHSIVHLRVLSAMIPLLIILLLGAVLYPPNNYDSMSYHMARVAHWIQEQSVDYYPTSIDRQNVMGPGAEYLILVPQLLAKSDVLANCVQYISYIALLATVLFVLRMLTVSRELTPYILILTATAPMAIMQATSTQNDIVAAAMTYAVIIAARRLYMGSIARFRYRDFALLGVCIAAGFLVKPTSLLAAGPFLMIGGGLQLARFTDLKKSIGKCILGGTVVLVMSCVVAGPDILRKQSHNVSRYEVYPLFAKWDLDRLKNPVAIAAHNIAIPDKPEKLLSTLGYDGPFNTTEVLSIHEDLIGNPFQVMALGLLATGTLLAFPLVMRRKKLLLPYCLSLTPLIAWVLFGLIVKDQLWISRLQLPLFCLLPFSFIFLLFILKGLTPIDKVLKATIIGSAFIALTYSLVVAGNNPHRPIKLGHFWGHIPDRTWSYYNNALHEDRLSHQQALDVARSQGCARIGLLLGGNSNEYPLTWRLMQEGREARHIQTGKQNDEWPCLYYVEFGQEHRLHDRGVRWRTVDGHTYARNLAGEFNRATHPCLTMTFPESLDRLEPSSDNVLFEPSSDGVVVRALNEDPQLFLPEFDCSSAEWVVMEVVLVSWAETTAQVYYKTTKLPEYAESQSFKQVISQGENKIYFQFPGNQLNGLVRFDPGQVPGDYKLKSISVRQMNR